MTYDNSNKGTLGKNKRKEAENHPDYSGQCEIDGTAYWISGWLKENKTSGEKFFSLSFKPKEARAEKPASRPAGGKSSFAQDLDEEIPF